MEIALRQTLSSRFKRRRYDLFYRISCLLHLVATFIGLGICFIVVSSVLLLFGLYPDFKATALDKFPFKKYRLPSYDGVRILPIYLVGAYLLFALFFQSAIFIAVLQWSLGIFVLTIVATIIGCAGCMDYPEYDPPSPETHCLTKA